MKRINIIFIFLLSPIVTLGQEYFQINDGALIWRKVYNESASAESVAYNLKNDGHFRQVEISGDIITAELHGLMMEYQSLGYRRMLLPIYITNNSFSAFVTIQFREGRYRVTAERILTINTRLGSGPLDDLALEGGEFDSKFLDAPCIIISTNFDMIFSKLSRDTTTDEW